MYVNEESIIWIIYISIFNYADSFSPFEEAEKLNDKLPPVIDITYLHVLHNDKKIFVLFKPENGVFRYVDC